MVEEEPISSSELVDSLKKRKRIASDYSERQSFLVYVTLSPFRSAGAKQINHPLCGCASLVIPKNS
ncbi:hypothetical protein, partial [Streptococcus moroccensis]|uniref:hypothetical protein n=2 Tax=Streptococcus moroccensis TaxID=1451356 RepID=UPI0027D8A44E